MTKCWKCGNLWLEFEGIGIEIADNQENWKRYTRYLCHFCLLEFGAFKKRKNKKQR